MFLGTIILKVVYKNKEIVVGRETIIVYWQKELGYIF
jgi:hypothetical protein